MSRQYDLFGEIEAAEQRKAAWIAQFERDWWIAPWDTATGMKAGDKKLGWVCPNCGTIEPNEYLLHINHGYAVRIPSEIGEQCVSQWLRANHARYDHDGAGR